MSRALQLLLYDYSSCQLPADQGSRTTTTHRDWFVSTLPSLLCICFLTFLYETDSASQVQGFAEQHAGDARRPVLQTAVLCLRRGGA